MGHNAIYNIGFSTFSIETDSDRKFAFIAITIHNGLQRQESKLTSLVAMNLLLQLLYRLRLSDIRTARAH